MLQTQTSILLPSKSVKIKALPTLHNKQNRRVTVNLILLQIQSNVVHPLPYLFLQHLHLHPLRFFVIIMEVEDGSIALEVKDLLEVEDVDDAQLMDVAPSLVLLGLEGLVFYDLIDAAEVLSQVALEDLFVDLRRRVVDDFLGLWIQCFYLVSDPSVDVLVKNFEDVIFLPYVNLYIREVFLALELLPKLEVFDLLVLHEFFEFYQ